jgi:hypothetical protein
MGRGRRESWIEGSEAIEELVRYICKDGLLRIQVDATDVMDEVREMMRGVRRTR